MPVIRIQSRELERLGVSAEELEKNVRMLGADLKDASGDEIQVEFFPDRPDLYTVEGVARALKIYMGKEKPKRYDTKEGDVKIKVDSSVKGVRPYIVGAVVKNVPVDELMIKSMMDFQEKLHITVGRKRKKVAIGLHDFDKVVPPFTYTTKPGDFSFVPLGFEEKMSLEEILEKHPKGVEYGDIIKGKGFPMILDSRGEVLSFPPIINGVLTQITEETKNIFIDITGTDLATIKKVLNIIAASFQDRGGEVYSVEIDDGEKIRVPEFEYEKMRVDFDQARKLLGMNLSDEDIRSSLEKMGYFIHGEEVEIPPYRMDILNPVDIVEDIAKGFSYDRIEIRGLKKYSRGRGFEWDEKIKLIMVGLGFLEIKSLTLSSFETQYDKMNVEREEKIIVENPVSEATETLRSWLIPSLMEILQKNKHRDLPQKIFEAGYVRSDSLERHLAFLYEDSKVGFTDGKSIVERILQDLNVKYEITEEEHGSFIPGRCAAILIHGEKIGFFGEIHPKVIENFELGYPIVGGEINLEKIREFVS